jgi:hypothetical protein
VELQDLLSDVEVKLGVVDFVALEGETHEGDDALVVHAGVHNGLSGVQQVPDVVHVVEVPVPGGFCCGHHLALEGEAFRGLGGEGHPRNRPGEDLKVGIGSHCPPELPHVLEGVLPEVEKGRLEPSPTTELEVADAGLSRELHGRKEVMQPYLPAEAALKPVAERGEHHPDLFGFVCEDHRVSSTLVTFVPGKAKAVAELTAAMTAGSIPPTFSGKAAMRSRITTARKVSRANTATNAEPQIASRFGSMLFSNADLNRVEGSLFSPGESLPRKLGRPKMPGRRNHQGSRIGPIG